MITLYGSAPSFGLPEASPFVAKARILFKLSGIDPALKPANFKIAPKGKIPYIDDDGRLIADSGFIDLHLQKKTGIDFDAGLTPEQKGIGWALQKLCEDQLYWMIVRDRWLEPENFEKGPATFFQAAPAPIRPLIKWMLKKRLTKTLHGQGTSRYTRDERKQLATRSLESISAVLGSKAWLFGEMPHSADATVAAFIISALCPLFDTDILEAARAQPNLVAYRDRALKTFFPEFVATG